jgi:hypothetical protein
MTLVMLDTGMEIPPSDAGATIAAAGKAFEAACRRQKGEPGERGGDVSGRVRSEAVQARCETIRERWALPNKDHPTKALLAEADVSKPTAIKWLGLRAEAQRRYQAAQATGARNKARRKKDVES